MDSRTSYFGERLQADPELARLQALERVFDQVTTRVLEDLVVPEPGWRCLELGAGAGSVVRWLADRVGPTGHVLAVDVNCRFLDQMPPNIDVVESDVAALHLGDGDYDLVHHRAVLAYVQDREQVAARAAAALRPGGWLVAEEPVLPPVDPAWVLGDTEDGAVVRSLRSVTKLLGGTGMDATYGLRLPSLLDEIGLTDPGHRGATFVARGGSVESDLIWPLLVGLEPFLVESGDVDHGDVARAVERFRDPSFATLVPTLISAWGRRAS
jgi:SAM-dependent methyltransferase